MVEPIEDFKNKLNHFKKFKRRSAPKFNTDRLPPSAHTLPNKSPGNRRLNHIPQDSLLDQKKKSIQNTSTKEIVSES